VRRRLLAGGAALTAAAMVGAIAAIAVDRSSAPAARTAPPPMSTARIVRTDLTQTVLTEGTLGYAPARPVVNDIAGTYTWLPAAGSEISAGDPLYRVDNLPVVLMAGRTPAWRSFALDMTDGPDVAQLQANLIAEGDAAGLLTAATGHFDLATADAVLRWQAARGYPATGQIALGQVVFLPDGIRVGAPQVASGEAAAPGQRPLAATTPRRTVTVPVNPSLPPVHPGEPVTIVLPSQATTPGKVTAVGLAAPGSAAAAGSAAQITIMPLHPAATGAGAGVPVQVSLSIQSVRQVLAVPVAALLALAGGGYGLEVVTPAGRHHLIGVRTGTFAGGQVQVSGAGVVAGIRVVTAQ
jgi:peptidoglycan hydrolase-like protein with peptidoglycan-binding domain